jgi:GT2 family glycosyltransferase
MNFSFIILSYNRSEATKEALDNVLFFLDKPKGSSIEVIIVNNDSSEDYSDLECYIDELKNVHFDISYIKNNQNLGVAGGRNQAMRVAKLDIIVSLDDDAEFREKDMMQQCLDLFQKYEKEQVKLLTFKVVEQTDGSIDIATKRKENYNIPEFFTSYFKGGCHAIIREVLAKTGMYDVDGLYGAEEYDLSYKIIDHRYKIVHSSHVSILHKRVLSGRLPSDEMNAKLMLNKTVIAYKFLPYKYYLSHLLLWSGFVLKRTKLNLPILFKTITSILKQTKGMDRQVISKEAQAYILSNGGRLTH